MPELNEDDWLLTPDGERVRFTGDFEWPINPAAGVGMAIFKPKRSGENTGKGFMVGVPAIVKGDPGLPPDFEQPTYVFLEPGDPTPDSVTRTEISPPTANTRGVYQDHFVMHKGPKGDDGDATWDPTDLDEEPVAGYIPAVTSGLTGFELVPQKFTEVFFPGAIQNVSSGTANATLTQINIASRPWPRRIRPIGYTVVTGGSPDVRVDLVARLNGELGGNIIGSCPSIAQTERLTLIPGKVAGAADTFDTLAAGQNGVVYIRTELRAGSATYITSADTSLFSVEALPL